MKDRTSRLIVHLAGARLPKGGESIDVGWNGHEQGLFLV
jgi:hypothetical protein